MREVSQELDQKISREKKIAKEIWMLETGINFQGSALKI